MDPIRKSVTVPLSPGEAFDLFTADLASWWPVDTHSLSAGDGALPRSVTLEPREGGQIVEEKHDGSTAPWGRITSWEAGQRLGIAWHVGREESEATEVFVTFTPVETGTRVDLVHDGFAALGETATALAANYDTGWDLVLGRCFARACQGHKAAVHT